MALQHLGSYVPCTTLVGVHRKLYLTSVSLFPGSGALAGNPLDIDREMLRSGNVCLRRGGTALLKVSGRGGSNDRWRPKALSCAVTLDQEQMIHISFFTAKIQTMSVRWEQEQPALLHNSRLGLIVKALCSIKLQHVYVPGISQGLTVTCRLGQPSAFKV